MSTPSLRCSTYRESQPSHWNLSALQAQLGTQIGAIRQAITRQSSYGNVSDLPLKPQEKRLQ